MRAVAITLALLVWGVALDADAQRRRRRPPPPPPPVEAPLPEPDPDEQARLRFFAGAELYQEGNLEGALAEWDASYRIRPVPVVTYNIALALRDLFRYHEAIQAFRRYLEESGGSIPPARRNQVAETIRDLQRRVAPITIDVRPAGARVLIDGRQAGVAPLREPLVLSAGRRVLELSADGHLPLREEIEVIGGEPRALTLRLAQQETAGTLRVTTTPARARVRIDGLEAGEAPIERQLPSGGHVVEALLDGHELYRTSIDLADRQRLDLLAVLEEHSGPGLTSRWWFWAGVSAIVIGGAVAAFVLLQPEEADPVPGNSFPGVVEALRAAP